MKSNKPYKSLKDVYSENVTGHVAPRRHLNVLGEGVEKQRTWMGLTKLAGPHAGEGKGREKVPVIDPDTGKPKEDPETGEIEMVTKLTPFDPRDSWEDAPTSSEYDLTFDKNDLEEINNLPPKIKHRIDRLLGKKGTQKQFKGYFGTSQKDDKGEDVPISGISAKLEDEFIESLIVSDEITSAEISQLFGQIKKGEAVDVDKILNANDGQVFSYTDIFTDEALKAYIAAKKVGAGGKQTGPGEIALAALSPKISVKSKGDINIAGHAVELKEGDGRIGLEKMNPTPEAMNGIFKKHLNENWNQELKDLANENVHNTNPGQTTLNIEGLWYLMKIVEKAEKEQTMVNLADGWKENLPRELFEEFFTDGDIITELVKSIDKQGIGQFTRDYIKGLFDNYKSSKKDTDDWDILLAINTTNPSLGGIAVVKSGDNLLNVRAKRSLPSIIKSGPAGNRDYTFAFSPYGPEENEEYEEL